ncbi:LLM class flavin-dependent oxidoreductase [Streptomyces tendae]
MDDEKALRRSLRLGVFMPPWTIPVDRDPTRFIRENIELVEFLDTLGYDEAWMGEHHSSGYQLIGSPELFVAAAIERTRRIRIGTGVISLPYHNPFMVAARIVQLDHQAQGRAMFGFGQGLTPTDSAMLGLDPQRKREQTEACLDVVLRLLDGETVTRETDWFNLYDASLQLDPFSQPRPDLVVASAVSTSGGENAGKHGIGMLCVAAGAPGAFDALDSNWRVANEQAAAHGHTMERTTLRLTAPFHIAPSRDQAMAEVEAGFEAWKEFIERGWPGGAEAIGKGSLESIVENGTGVIGTADDALAFLDRLWKKSGGYGCLLNQITNWAPLDATKSSLRILADKVMPEFTGRNRRRLTTG